MNTRKDTLVAPCCISRFYCLFFPPFHLVNLRSCTQKFFLIIHSVSVHITPSLILLWACQTPSSILYIGVGALIILKSFIVFRAPHKSTSATIQLYWKRQDSHLNARSLHAACLSRWDFANCKEVLKLDSKYLFSQGSCSWGVTVFSLSKPSSLHLNIFFFFLKMNHVLMYTHGDFLSLFLRTTHSVYRN